MSSAVPALGTPDLLSGNGAFDTAAQLGAWTVFTRPGSAATKTLEGATAKIQVTQSTGDLGGVVIYPPSIPVTAGTHYTLSFRARSDSAQVIQAIVNQAASPWPTYMSTSDLPLSTTWQTYELPLTSTGTDAAALFTLTMGRSTGTIWIDDVKLQAGDRNVYRRDYENGVALVNATADPVTVNLGGVFRKIKGTQAPLVNDGRLVTAVTLPAKDGLVLLRTEPVDPGSYDPMPVHRFRNLKNGYYLWSADEAEKETIIRTLGGTWAYEGVAYQVNRANELNHSPLWRFRNIAGGFYLYTADPAEKARIIAQLSNTWRFEGEAYQVSTDPSGYAVWRFRNLRNGTYLYSADSAEAADIVAKLQSTWQLEGIAYDLAP
jgi:hypothetical protein